MRVRVFLNRQEDEVGRLAIFSRFRTEDAYQAGDKLECVYEYLHRPGTPVEAVLERVFSDFNRGSPTFVGDALYPQRSLSVGDVVEVSGVRYAVAPVGFKEVK